MAAEVAAAALSAATTLAALATTLALSSAFFLYLSSMSQRSLKSAMKYL